MRADRTHETAGARGKNAKRLAVACVPVPTFRAAEFVGRRAAASRAPVADEGVMRSDGPPGFDEPDVPV